ARARPVPGPVHRAGDPPGPARTLPQRPAQRELHRRRRRHPNRRLGIRGHGRSLLRLRQLRRQSPAVRGGRGRPAGRLFRPRHPGPARPVAIDAPHVRLPRSDVGRASAGDLRARLRFLCLFAQALQPAARRCRRSALRRLAQPGRGVTLPDRARAVIIGGGVGGTSIAYHLTKRDWRDIVLLERAQLTSGSTFHSAGLVGQLRSTMPLTRLMMDSVALYGRLKEETGVDVGWRPVGSLRLASSTERMEELERQAGWGTSFGLPLELVSAAEARRRFPLMAVDGVIGAAFLPTDGYLDPSGLVMGGYERDPAPWGLAGIAPDFNNRLLPEDWPRFMPLSQNAITRVPALEKGDVVKLINGPEAFTPDNEFLLGESAVRGFYVAAGFCAHGIAGAGGMGAAMAEWIID